ncbi:LysR family transcriptional regulator, partial [Buchnera aphidicola (Hormaphis cornu)]
MITLKQLKILQTLYSSNTLSRAAIKLHKTQSALSHNLNQLEKKLGFQLFLRKTKPLKFTKQGKILFKLSNQILPVVDTAIRKCNAFKQSKLNIA